MTSWNRRVPRHTTRDAATSSAASYVLRTRYAVTTSAAPFWELPYILMTTLEEDGNIDKNDNDTDKNDAYIDKNDDDTDKNDDDDTDKW